MLPVRPVNPSETFQFQGMLKYFIFSKKKSVEGKHFDRCISILFKKEELFFSSQFGVKTDLAILQHPPRNYSYCSL